MADAAGIAAITGGTGAIVAFIGHLNTRRQARVAIETAREHAAIEKEKLEHERQKSLAQQRGEHREARLAEYAQYLAILDEVARFADGVTPVTRESWLAWRERDTAFSNQVLLLAGPRVYKAAQRMDDLVIEAKRAMEGETYDIAACRAVVRSTRFWDARFEMVAAMRVELGADLDPDSPGGHAA
jgi:hypothetical protein